MKKLLAVSALLLFFALPVWAIPITVSSTSTAPSTTYPGSTCTLRIYSSVTFTALDGTVVLAGTPGTGAFFKSVPCTIASGVITIPAFVIPSTLDAVDNQTARYTAVFYDSKGIKRDTFYANFFMPSSLGSTLSWQQIRIANGAIVPVRDTNTYSRGQTDNQILLSTQGIYNETPAGSVNGSNATFTLARTPVAGSDEVFLNGIRQTRGSLGAGTESYTISGAVITHNLPPQTGDYLTVNYRTSSGLVGTNIATQISEGGGPTTLTVGAIADGQYLVRSGSTVVGAGGDAVYRPTCSGTNDTAVFSAMIAAAGVYKATIELPNMGGSACALNSLTIPANITLDSSAGTGVRVNSGQTLTILGPVVAPPKHIFDGVGGVSFTGNTVQRDFWVAWWGADEETNPVNMSALFNLAFAAMPFGTTMHLSPMTYQHAGITIDHKAQITVVGNDSLDGYIDPGWGTNLVYVGANGGNAITLNNVYGSTFKGFAVLGALTNTTPGTTGAAKGIYLTMTPGGNPPTSSQDVFQSLKVQSVGTRSDFIAVDISNASGSNNEFHRFNKCKLYGGLQSFPNQTGRGIYLGHSNVKNIIIDNTTFSSFATAIYSGSGSFRAYSPTFDNNYAVVAGAVSDGSSIIGADGENNVQILAGLQGSGTVPFALLYSRFDNLYGGQAVTAQTTNAPVLDSRTRNLIVEGCDFGAYGTFTSDFIYGGTNFQALLSWNQNNIYNQNNSAFGFSQSDLIKGFNTFATWTQDGHVLGGPRVGTGVSGSWASWDGMTSSNNLAKLISIQGDPATGAPGPLYNGVYGCAQDNVCVGAGEVEIGGLRPASSPSLATVGTAGSTGWTISVVALDSAGRKTFRSYSTAITTANATLTGSNKIVVTFPHVAGAASYDILRANPADGAYHGLVVNQAASGTGVQTVNITANFGGPYTYALPLFNETGYSQFNSPYRRKTTAEKAAAYTVVGNDEMVPLSAAGNFTVTLPPATNRTGETHTFKVTAIGGAFTVTINGGGTNIDAAATYTGLNALYKYLSVQSNGTIWMITGNN